jgi:pilus assembly protein TadC
VTVPAVVVAVLVLAGAAAVGRGPARLQPRRPPPRRPWATSRRHRVDAVASLPEVVDLLAVAVGSGLPVAAALGAVSGRSPPPWRQALEGCLRLAADGALLDEALGSLATVGDEAAPLLGVLRAGLVDGDRLGELLTRLAADSRDLRRRRAQEQARRIPVQLLLPLVLCSLPAFAVLTIVPILAGALHDLRWPP